MGWKCSPGGKHRAFIRVFGCFSRQLDNDIILHNKPDFKSGKNGKTPAVPRQTAKRKPCQVCSLVKRIDSSTVVKADSCTRYTVGNRATRIPIFSFRLITHFAYYMENSGFVTEKKICLLRAGGIETRPVFFYNLGKSQNERKRGT